MYLTLKGCTGYLGHPLLRQEHRGVHEEQGRGFTCREGCFSRLFPVADSAKQEARLPTDLVPRACVRHSLLPCEQGKRKKTCPRPDRSLGHDRGTDRNRRDSNSLSPVLIHFLAPHGKLYQRLLRKQDSGLVPSLTSSLCRICMCREMTELVRCALLVPSTQNKHSRGGRYDNG